jgi:NitT/TauT family transport system substrate-binding protein
VVVAAMFQKDPQALFAHPGSGFKIFADLKQAKTVFVAKDAQYSWWPWLRAEHGFKDEQLRPYNYNLGPFLANRASVQQGYAVEEPISIEKAGGFKPLTFLLADNGYSSYSTTIEARWDTVRKQPDLVQRFVDASIIGWVRYLYGDRSAADALIKRDNPEMNDATIGKSVALMKEMGIVDSGDSLAQGIGAMTSERVARFLASMVKAGLYTPGEVDLQQVATYQFVNHGVGLTEKKSLQTH